VTASPQWLISPLDTTHDRAPFDCGKPSLNNYLKTLASQHQKRGIGRTFVLTRPPGPPAPARVLAFYTLASSSVAFEHMPEGEKLPRYPIPLIRLAQLAVDHSMHRQRLGELLLLDALARAHRISKQAAVFAVEVDALDDSAIAFYKKYSFMPLKDNPLHLYLPMKAIAKLRLNG
jgi:GNAT superfamily N-acetyltransferase